MLFQFRHAIRRAKPVPSEQRVAPTVQPGQAVQRLAATLLIAAGLATGAPVMAQQAAPTSAQPNASAPTATTQAAGTTTPPTNSSSLAAALSNDPVSRFLVEKGLIDTSPVKELAQQVRDKATDMASQLVTSAMDFLGVRYKRGGESRESGFDCSGFTRHVFENSVGLILPRRAVEQANSPDLVPVTQADLKPGDLVFFNTLKHTFSHVGIYVGDNKFIHSPRAGGAVRVEDIREAYWQKRFDGARRAPNINANARPATGLPNTKTAQAQQ